MSHNNDDLNEALKKATKKRSTNWLSDNNVLIGWLLILLGVGLGLYVGLYVMFIGGIIQIITQFGAPVIEASVIAWGVVKMIFAAAVGWIVALSLIFPGFAIANTNTHKHRRTRW